MDANRQASPHRLGVDNAPLKAAFVHRFVSHEPSQPVIQSAPIDLPSAFESCTELVEWYRTSARRMRVPANMPVYQSASTRPVV